MSDPEDKNEKTPPSKPGVTPGEKTGKEAERLRKEGSGTVTEVAPDVPSKGYGAVQEIAPDVRPDRGGSGTVTEVAPESQYRGQGTIKEVAPDVKSKGDPGTITEVAPETQSRTQGVIKEMAPDVGLHRTSGPIREMAPDVGRTIRPEVAPEVGSTRGGLRLLYGPTIQAAIAEGDLSRMKQLAVEAERHLSEWGDVRAALEHLKIEIAKLEHRKK